MCNPRSSVHQWALAIILFIILILSIALLAMGSRLQTDSAPVHLMSGYTPSLCTLDAVQVNRCPRTGEFVAVWRRTEDEGSVLESPFSFRSSQDLAVRDMNNFPFNETMNCMCNTNLIDPFPALTCTFGDACFLDVPAVNYIQTVGFVYSYSAATLLGVGSILIVCAAFGALFLVVSNGFCCGNVPPQQEMTYERAKE